ncbi:hypothetical protein F5Y03DRAFT_374609 [Xylaria venustula]|nr:hypothetical protein F5Y03DRAFT_374609 [Xylaria venustula]
MASAKNTKHPVRKSRQSSLPTIKFRSSCDACTEAKVRCDKQRPQCSRCARMESSCRYSVSLRTGKPACDLIKALNGGVLTMPPPRSTHTPPHDADTLTMAELLPRADSCQSFRSVTQVNQDTSSEPANKCVAQSTSDSDSSPVPIGPYRHTDSMDLDTAAAESSNIVVQSGRSADSSTHSLIDGTSFDDISTNAHSLYLSMMEAGSTGYSFSAQPPLDLDYFADFDFSEPELLRTIEIPTPNSIAGNGHDNTILLDPALQQSQNQLYGHSCLNTAKMLQKSILAMSTRNEMMQGELNGLGCPPSITTIDQALLMCSNASQQVVEILKCQCKADAHLPFLITVLISKVLATYGAIAKADDSTPFNFGTPSPTPMEQELEHRRQHNQEEAFAAVPLRLGVYDVDRELEETLRGHIVLHELLKLKGMVQLFAEKYCHAGTDKKHQSEGGLIYSALGQFVQERYAATMAACAQRSTATLNTRSGDREVG